MIKREIVLTEVGKIQAFNTIASHCPYDVDLQQGKYLVDAKSIMGIFSLNLEQTVMLILHTEDQTEEEKFSAYFVSGQVEN